MQPDTYYIFQIQHDGFCEYFFIINNFWSSDMPSLETLADIGLDDNESVLREDIVNEDTEYLLEALNFGNPNISFLFSTPTLENLEDTYPEYFI
jgi:hypothetical protein